MNYINYKQKNTGLINVIVKAGVFCLKLPVEDSSEGSCESFCFFIDDRKLRDDE